MNVCKNFFLIIVLFFIVRSGYAGKPDSNSVWKDLVKEIAIGVAITEGMNYLYSNQKLVWAPLKSVERYKVVKIGIGVCKATWDYYMVWKKTMDKIAGFVDDMEEAKICLENAQKTGEAIYGYYRDFDWDKVKLTNITCLLPYYRFAMLDYYINGATYYAARAFNQLAFAAVLVDAAIYNPARLNKIGAAQRAFNSTLNNIAAENKFINDPEAGLGVLLNDIVQGTTNGASELHSGALYHVGASMASLAYNMDHTRIRTATTSMLNTTMLLDFIESEAQDWNKELVFIQGAGHDFSTAVRSCDWSTTNMFIWNNSPVVFNRDIDPSNVKDFE